MLNESTLQIITIIFIGHNKSYFMIHIITTGGTIEGLDYDSEKNQTQENKISIEDFFRSANVSFSYSIENVLNKDSRFITDDDRRLLVDKIKATSAKKIIVTHGTFTM